ncbi:MAG: transporter substrate-binding protein [Clostridia bacterium]|jgi:hypothetical protein|nr:transporter substrate-binding protein [Clostridia bacterium]
MAIKKLFSLLFILIFIFTFVGCGNTEGTEEEVVEEETNHAIDLDGYEFTFAIGIDFANPIGIQPYFPLEGTSTPGDAILARYREIEDAYNCTIVEKQVNDWYQKDLFAATAVGEKYADMINTLSETAYVVYRNNMLESYSGNEFIDLTTGKWGSKLALELMTFDGENCFGVQPDLWPVSERGSGIYNAVLFNPDVIKYYQQPDPYELQEQGVWNWANFEDIAVNCTEGETAEDKKYGISSQHDDFAISAVYSNNGQMVKNVDGHFTYGYTDTVVIDALTWMQDLMFKKKVIGTSTSDWWGGMKLFSTGRSAFHVGRSFFGLTVPTGTAADEKFPSSMLENGYGWVPFPYGPNSNKDDWNIIFDCVERFFVVPVGSDPDISMRIMDDMFKKIEGIKDWKENYRQYLFFEEKGFNNFMKMIEVAETSYLHIYDGWDGRQYIVNAFTDLMKNAKKSPIQTVESLKDKYQTMIDERLNNIEG